ncbi:MAG: lipopolysaccharide heptosyltransferase II [Casimicrobiaceae bacterium]
MSSGRILVVAPNWIGDAIISQPLLALLRRRDPATPIDVLAPAWVAPVYARMPEVGAVIDSPFRHGELAWRRRRALAKSLAARGYAQAIVLPNSLKSAAIPWLAGIPLRTGYIGEQRYGLLNDRRRLNTAIHPRLVDRFAALAFSARAARPGGPAVADLPTLTDPALRIDPVAQAATLAKFGLASATPVVALCPGAEYGPAKRWPARYYADIAKSALADARQVWIFGSPKDAQIGREIAAAAPGAVDLCGRTDLTEAIDLLALAEVVLTNDSGLMHVASAAGCRVVALFGSSTPVFTPPLSSRARTISLQLECSPCFERTCPLGHMNCLNQLKPAQVQDTIAGLPS